MNFMTRMTSRNRPKGSTIDMIIQSRVIGSDSRYILVHKTDRANQDDQRVVNRVTSLNDFTKEEENSGKCHNFKTISSGKSPNPSISLFTQDYVVFVKLTEPIKITNVL